MEHDKLSLLSPVLDSRPIDQWKVTELKEELKRRKLAVKGLKEDLIKRLDEAIRNEIEVPGNIDNVFVGIPHTESESELADTVLVGAETARDVIYNGDNRTGVDGVTVQLHTDDTAASLGEGEFQDGEVIGSTDSASKEELLIHATSVEMSITISKNVVSEIALSAQESQNNETPDERGNLEPQLENVDPKSSHEDVKLKSSDPNNQVSEISPVLGFQVKSDLISPDSISIKEKNELKENLIADNVTLDLDIKPEMVKPSSTNVVPDGGELHPMDVEEPLEDKVSVEERDDDNAENADISKKDGNADISSSEKLHVDRIIDDGYMEEDSLESKTIEFPVEVGDRGEKTEVPVVKEDDPVDVVGDDIPANKKDIHGKNENGLVAPTVKRKFKDQGVVGNIETSKRHRRWSSESLKVPEPQIITLPSSTTPKDTFPSSALRRNFARSVSTVSEDAPKEHVVPPSPRTPTNSLRIDRFLRPFTLKAVQELLGKTGTLTNFWMDQIKTHCYVTYSSVDEAIATRNAVYDLQWPSNGGHLLVAEFVDPQEVKLRVDPPPQSLATPVSTGPNIPSAPPTLLPQPSPRQHVKRQQLPPPPPTLLPQPSSRQHVQRPQLPPPPPILQPQPSPRQHVQRQLLPPPPPLPHPLPLSTPPPARERLTLPPPPPLPEKVDPPVITLDDLFRKTKANPRIYYLPLSDEQVAAKLKAQGKNANL
ncbi:formin-like protein 5 [Cornus florida]|uniref:formin-like protein 5 n=1 Tax=Cornus florida TaxID=4283 RepID=UPI00289B34B4|nr:formin-like protein 5 [Cornus florida]